MNLKCDKNKEKKKRTENKNLWRLCENQINDFLFKINSIDCVLNEHCVLHCGDFVWYSFGHS